MAILTNEIVCSHCGFVLQSLYRHDFRTHSCEAMQTAYGPNAIIGVDGGLSYLRRVYTNFSSFDDISTDDGTGPET